MLFGASILQGQRITTEKLVTLSEESDVIIEGKVIDVTTYRNDSDGYIYTEYHLKVSRLAKNTDWLDEGEVIKFSVPGGIFEDKFTHVTHNAYFDVGNNGVFFLRASAAHNNHRLGLTRKHKGVLLYGDYKSIHDVMHVKFGVRQINQLLSDIEEIIGQNFSKFSLNSAEGSIANFLEEEQLESNADIQTEVVYVIVSGVTLTTNSDSVNFYISLLSPNDDLKYSKSDLRLSYNTDSFGEYVETNEKMKSEVKDLAENVSYLEDIFDQAANVVRLKLDIDVTELEQHPDFSGGLDLLYEVKVKIEDISELISNLEDFHIDGEVYYKDELGNQPFDVVKFNLGNPFGMTPQITDVYPLNITAGTQSILNIEGSNFTSDYRIFMRNGGGGSTSLVEIRPEDITWTEGLITIELPSDATELDGLMLPTSGREPAGSGPIVLTNNVDIITSDEIVNVDYAIINSRYPDFVEDQTRIMQRDANGLKGRTWRIHQNMTSVNGEADVCIEQAFCDFNQACGVKYQLNNVEHTEQVINGNDGVSVIGFVSDDPTFTAPGETFFLGSLGTCTDGSGAFRLYIDEIDIRINNNGLRTWDFDCGRTNEIDAANFDFYTALKHEIGHSITLGHSLTLPEDPINDIGSQPLVYYGVILGETNNSIDTGDQNALNDAMNYNTTDIWGGDCPDRILYRLRYFEQHIRKYDI